jgi:ABC-type glycerol-3-phosphate transport system substrate-binding protein
MGKVFTSKLGVVCIVSLLSAFSIGCSSGGQENVGESVKKDTGPKSMSIIFQYSNDQNRAGVEAVIGKFKESNPDIEVSSQGLPLDQFYQVLQTRIGSKNLPDVAVATPVVIPGFASQGILADLTPYLPKDYLKAFPEARTSVHRQGDKIVGAPISNSIRAVAYNKTAFDKAGIKAPGVNDAPWTWDQIVEAAKTLQDKKLVTYGLQFEKPSFDGWLPFLYQNGGALVDENGKPAINNKAGVEAIEWTAKLHKEGLAAPGIIEGTDDPLRLFASGQVGIWLNTGPFMVPTLQKQVTNFEYSFMYLPQKVKNTTIIGGSDIIAFNNGHVEEAAKFIQFATSAENITLQTNPTGGLPARGDAKDVKFAREDLIPLFTKQSGYMDSLLISQYLTDYYSKSKDQMLRELQTAVIGQATAQEAADKMAEILQSQLKK